MLTARAVAYINCDIAVAFYDLLLVAASPLLRQPVYDAAKKVKQLTIYYVNHIDRVNSRYMYMYYASECT